MAQLPAEFVIESVRFTNRDSVTATESQSLITLERALPAQRWDFTLRSILLAPDDSDLVWAYFAARKQDLDVTEVFLPRWSESGVTSRPTTAAAAIGDTTIAASDTNLKAGLYLSFAGHTKVYVVTDVGLNSFTVAPSLRAPVASGETITFDGVVWTMKIRNRPLEFQASGDTNHIRMELDMVEAL